MQHALRYKPRRGLIRAGLVGLVIVSLLVGTSGPAGAHRFGRDDGGTRYTDALPVTFASDETNFDHHLFWNHFVYYQQQEYDAYTDLRMQEVPRLQWNFGTDVVWFAYPIFDLGDAECRNPFSYHICDRTVIRFRENLTRRPDVHSVVFFHLVCHELSHAYGFDHIPHVGEGGGSCQQVTSYDPNQSWGLNGHMIDHINAVY